MLYGKLPVVLLSIAATEKGDSINSLLASYILRNAGKVAGMGIKELAADCHVGIGSVSRFCREIGLESYGELQQLLSIPENEFQRLAYETEEMATGLAEKVGDGLKQAAASVDMEQVQAVCKEIRDYPQVAAFGLMKGAAAALCLQSDLLLLGKQIYTNISYPEQLDYIAHADKNDLILLFSYTGSYFDYPGERVLPENIYTPQIVLITGADKPCPHYVDRVLSFASRQDQVSHPYQLQLMAGLVAQEYARLTGIS